MVYTGAFAFAMLLKMTYAWLADPNSPYPFDAEEMARFGVDRRLAHLHRDKPNG